MLDELFRDCRRAAVHLEMRDATDIALPGNDFWLFDSGLVLVNHFDGDGENLEVELTEDAEVAKLCESAFEAGSCPPSWCSRSRSVASASEASGTCRRGPSCDHRWSQLGDPQPGLRRGDLGRDLRIPPA